MATITIEPRLPIIAGFVTIPDDNNNLPKVTSAEVIAIIPTAYVMVFGTTDKREFLVLPSYDSQSKAAEDYYEDIRVLARSKI